MESFQSHFVFCRTSQDYWNLSKPCGNWTKEEIYFFLSITIVMLICLWIESRGFWISKNPGQATFVLESFMVLYLYSHQQLSLTHVGLSLNKNTIKYKCILIIMGPNLLSGKNPVKFLVGFHRFIMNVQESIHVASRRFIDSSFRMKVGSSFGIMNCAKHVDPMGEIPVVKCGVSREFIWCMLWVRDYLNIVPKIVVMWKVFSDWGISLFPNKRRNKGFNYASNSTCYCNLESGLGLKLKIHIKKIIYTWNLQNA